MELGPHPDHLDLVVEASADLAPVVVGHDRRFHQELYRVLPGVEVGRRQDYRSYAAVVRPDRADVAGFAALVDPRVVQRHLEPGVLDHHSRSSQAKLIYLRGMQHGQLFGAEPELGVAGQEQVVEELPQVAPLELVGRVGRHSQDQHGLRYVRDVRVGVDLRTQLGVVHPQVLHQLLAGLVRRTGRVRHLGDVVVAEVGEREEAANHLGVDRKVEHFVQGQVEARTIQVHPVLDHPAYAVADMEVVPLVVVAGDGNGEAVLQHPTPNRIDPDVLHPQVLGAPDRIHLHRRGLHHCAGHFGTKGALRRVAGLGRNAPLLQRERLDGLEPVAGDHHHHVMQVHRGTLDHRECGQLVRGRVVAMRRHQDTPADVEIVR